MPLFGIEIISRYFHLMSIVKKPLVLRYFGHEYCRYDTEDGGDASLRNVVITYKITKHHNLSRTP